MLCFKLSQIRNSVQLNWGATAPFWSLMCHQVPAIQRGQSVARNACCCRAQPCLYLEPNAPSGAENIMPIASWQSGWMILVGPFQLNCSDEKCAMVPQLSKRHQHVLPVAVAPGRWVDRILLGTQRGETSIPRYQLFYQRINSTLLLLWSSAWQLNELDPFGVINGGHLENMK